MSSIKHLHALKPIDFYNVITNIDKAIITEKLDGINASFNFNQKQISVTQGNIVVYKHVDEITCNNYVFVNATKALLKALKYVDNNIKKLQCEILFGDQPNAIKYNNNMIVVIDGISNEKKAINLQKLNSSLTNIQINDYGYDIITNGLTNKLLRKQLIWNFGSVPYICNNLFNNNTINNAIKIYENWFNMNKKYLIDKKCNRRKYNILKTINDQHQYYISLLCVNLIKTIHSKYSNDNNDCIIEGIVIDINNIKTKIVDIHHFTVINQFNHLIRNNLQNTSRNKTNHFINLLNGYEQNIIGNMWLQYVKLLGITKTFPTNRTLATISSYMRSSVFNSDYIELLEYNRQNFSHIQEQLLLLLNSTINKIKHQLDHYMLNYHQLHYVLPNNTTLKYFPEINKRTLIYFATMIKKLNNVYYKIKHAKYSQDLWKFKTYFYDDK